MGHEALGLNGGATLAKPGRHVNFVAARSRRSGRREPVGEEILILGINEEKTGGHEPRLLAVDGVCRNFAGLPGPLRNWISLLRASHGGRGQ